MVREDVVDLRARAGLAQQPAVEQFIETARHRCHRQIRYVANQGNAAGRARDRGDLRDRPRLGTKPSDPLGDDTGARRKFMPLTRFRKPAFTGGAVKPRPLGRGYKAPAC